MYKRIRTNLRGCGMTGAGLCSGEHDPVDAYILQCQFSVSWVLENRLTSLCSRFMEYEPAHGTNWQLNSSKICLSSTISHSSSASHRREGLA